MKHHSVNSNKGNIFSGPLLFKPVINKDERGYFYESWNQKNFQKALNEKKFFVQDNESFSNFGVLRGLHYQLDPMPQGKLLKVSQGGIYDVLVDLRSNSKTFMEWSGIRINEDNKFQLWIPEGFAHGFLTLTNHALVTYKVTSHWSKDHEKILFWDDKDLGINWPLHKINIPHPLVSKKDSQGLGIRDLIKLGAIF